MTAEDVSDRWPSADAAVAVAEPVHPATDDEVVIVGTGETIGRSRCYHRPARKQYLRAACGTLAHDGQALTRDDAEATRLSPCQHRDCFGDAGGDGA